MSSKPTIGFIGLGLMGAAMCSRLLDQGYSLGFIVNRSRDAAEKLLARGATEYATAAELAAASDVVMLCVDTSVNVEARVLGPGGVIEGAKAGTTVIDFGTSLPGSTKKLGAALAQNGVAYLDSPIGRTPTHALEGKLNLMCSGDPAAFAAVKPVLEDLSENLFHLGPLGTEHAIKLINNFYAQSAANAMAEAFVMADKLGIERQKIYDVMRAGPGGSGMMDMVKGYGIDGDPSQLAFSVANACKDLGYYDQMASDVGVDSLMVKGALEALKDACDQGRGDTMVGEQVDYFAQRYQG